MKKTLQLISALALTFASLSGSASIVHTVSNNSIMAQGFMSIDMNNDGTPDFEITDMGFGGTADFATMFDPNDVNFVTWSQNQNWDIFKPLTAGEEIGASAGFYAQGDCYFTPMWEPTLFPAYSEEYIGVQFKINGQIHYGWCKVLIDPALGMLVLNEYAFEDQPGVSIQAGATSTVTGVESISSLFELKAFPVPGSTTLTIQTEVQNPVNNIRIINNLGEVVLTKSNLNSVSETVSISGLANGHYILQVASNQQLVTKQITVLH